MVNHKIYAFHNRIKGASRLPLPLIKHCVKTALTLEAVDLPCEVNVMITDDRGMAKLNLEFRGIDKYTDVLSFPMQGFGTAGWQGIEPPSADAGSGLIPLGEIVISAERVDAQAREYQHSRERETAYLTVHSVLHLLGYDHVDDLAAKRKMRGREKRIMCELGYEQ